MIGMRAERGGGDFNTSTHVCSHVHTDTHSHEHMHTAIET